MKQFGKYTSSLPFLALSAIASFSIFSTGCATATDEDTESDVADEEVSASSDELVTGANSGYFQVLRRDTRRCASPMCGGFFVKRVNEAKTTCADGSRQAECYVSSIQLTGMDLSAREESDFRTDVESGTALLKARTYKTTSRGRTFGVLKANEGWRALSGATVAATGSFYRAADNGIRCITAPCPSTTAYGLNGAASYNVIDVLFAPTLAPAQTLDRARHAISSAEGLLVSGSVALPKCRPDTNCGPLLVPTELYARVIRTEGKACGGRSAARTTCNEGQACQFSEGAICGRADASGTCAIKPEACIMLYAPVCGCDLVTYSNSCFAQASGTSVLSRGECPAGELEVTE